MSSINIANHEKSHVGVGYHLHLRGKKKGGRSENNLQIQQREGFCLLISGKGYFFQMDLHGFGGRS